MYVKDLMLINFRNYKKESLRFGTGLNILQGANGQGKTNLLEALYHLCLGRSFRTLKENDLVYWNHPYYFLKGNVFFQKRFFQIERGYELKKNRKVAKINGQSLKRGEKLNFCPIVFFVPEDLDLIRRGPEERRNFLDREIGQLSNYYRDCLQRYKRALLQKNRLLKLGRVKKISGELFKPWNSQLAYFGSRIMQQRGRLLSTWGELASRNFKHLFALEGEKNLRLEYRPGIELTLEDFSNIDEIECEIMRQIVQAEEEEKEKGFSLVGIHKDDFSFMMEGKEAKRFASHGQQRSAIISLKAAQIQYYSRNYEKPIFILDDIFSELDETRRKQCFSLFTEAGQIFITVALNEALTEYFVQQPLKHAIFAISNGTVQNVSSHN